LFKIQKREYKNNEITEKIYQQKKTNKYLEKKRDFKYSFKCVFLLLFI